MIKANFLGFRSVSNYFFQKNSPKMAKIPVLGKLTHICSNTIGGKLSTHRLKKSYKKSISFNEIKFVIKKHPCLWCFHCKKVKKQYQYMTVWRRLNTKSESMTLYYDNIFVIKSIRVFDVFIEKRLKRQYQYLLTQNQSFIMHARS